MNKRSSIRKKALAAILTAALIPSLIVSIASLSAMFRMFDASKVISDRLGDRAASDSAEALTEQILSEISSLAESRAEMIDTELLKIEEQTLFVAAQTEYILKHPGEYAPRPLKLLAQADENTTTPHIRLAPGVDLADVAEELNLLGNIIDAERSIETFSSGVMASYIGLESGLFIEIDKKSVVESGGYDCRKRGWYVSAKEAGALIWTDIFPDSDGRGEAIACAMPFYDADGRFAGVASSGALLGKVAEIINVTKIGDTGYAFLLDEAGGVIFSPGGVIPADNGDVFMATRALNATNWTVGVMIPRGDAIAPVTAMAAGILELRDMASAEIGGVIQTAIKIILFVLIASVLLTVLISRLFAARITKPVTVLTDGVNRIAAGDLDTAVAVRTNDEIGLLADGVNAMTVEIKNYISNLSRVTAEKERIGAELNVATRIQESMLPAIFPLFENRPDVDLFASMLPAKEVGGDFYDFFFIDEYTLAIVIADVSGKGVPAALFMVIAKTLIKNTVQGGKSPKEVFETVNNMLNENNAAGMFVTSFMGYLNVKTGELICVNAGHNPPLLTRSGSFERLKIKAGFVLAGRRNIKYAETVIKMEKGDTIYLYTDGVTEAFNSALELWGEAAFIESANRHKNKPSKEMTIAVKNDMDAFTNGAEQADDITMLVLRYKGEQSVSAIIVPAQDDQLEAVRGFIKEHLDAAGFAPKTAWQMLIAAEEIFVNIAHYSGSVTAEIAVEIAGDKAVVSFADSGKPFNPLDNTDPDVTLTAIERKQGGLGVYMTKKLTDGIEYVHADGKNILKIKKIIG